VQTFFGGGGKLFFPPNKKLYTSYFLPLQKQILQNITGL
jgi:hypothetical protein